MTSRIIAPHEIDSTDPELKKLVLRLTGLFSNSEQITSDLLSDATHLHTAYYFKAVPVEVSNLEALCLYTELGRCITNEPPTRVRLMHFFRDNSRLINSNSYELINQAEVIGAFSDAKKIRKLRADQLKPISGQSLLWTQSQNSFTGTNGGVIVIEGVKSLNTIETTPTRLVLTERVYLGEYQQIDGPPEYVDGEILDKISLSAIATCIDRINPKLDPTGYFVDW